MSMMSNELLLCADACPEVMPVAAKDPAIMTDRRVLQQLLGLEMFSVPSSDYFAPSSTSELQPYMRRVVTTWMLEVTEEQNCEEQVFPLAVNLLDRFLALEAAVLQRCQLQLLGCVCLLTASKLRQCRPIGVDLLVYYTDYSVTPAEIRVWEMLLLGKLGWDVSGVTAFDFVDHLMERIDLSSSSSQVSSGHNVPLTTGSVRDSAAVLRGHALTYVSLCCTETDYMRVRPSLIAAASISAAINRLGLSTSSSNDPSCEERLLADLVGTDVHQLASLVRSVESLMATQLASVQQQQDHHVQQQQQQQQQQLPHVKNNKMQTTTSSWELDVQPETPTDIQDIHF
ncbi:G1/S-specific cyclin-D2 [Daphnia magna]|uniref:G1/S-specific cyclin-D2 n=1 Tax=Daphnia magna TaxID=35525 RepID=UPI001E1BC764|nr:G1/S-specific cyclin-D2 [Daphnia magna]